LLTNVICMFDSAKYDSENKTNKKMHVQWQNCDNF
jgi:hypothetical protein